MKGGKSLWLIDAIIMDKDSLYNDAGKNVAIPRELNLTDYFFKYGIRINPLIVSSLYSAPISLEIGEGSNVQLQHRRIAWTRSCSNTWNDRIHICRNPAVRPHSKHTYPRIAIADTSFANNNSCDNTCSACNRQDIGKW